MAYIAEHNGQTFSTKGAHANFVVLVPIIKSVRIANTERAIESKRGRIGALAFAFGETEASLEMDAQIRKDIKNLEKHLADLRSVEGNVYFEALSWHNLGENAYKNARRNGGVVVATKAVA